MTHEAITTRFEPDPDFTDMTLPFEVYVHPTTALLNDFLEREGRVDFPYDDPDVPDDTRRGATIYDNDPGYIAIHLVADALHLAVVAHEAAHAALFMYDHDVLAAIPHATAARHIGNHDETIPYLVGNITALVWYWLGSEGFDLDPED